MADTPVSPTNVTALPTAPNRNTQTNPLTYSQTADAWAGALPTWTTQVNNIAANVNFNADSAFDSAAEALVSKNAAEAAEAAAIAATNATQWVSGQAYDAGDVVYSPINFLSYRANTNTSGTTDPSLSANWTPLNEVDLSTDAVGTLPVANGGTGITSFGTGVATALGNNTNATGGFVTVDGTATLTAKTLTDPAIIGTILEDVYTISDGAAFEIDPSNGSIQLITLGASRTPKATNFAAGESITLMVNDGTDYTLTWTDATWGGSGVIWETDAGVAPTLSTSGYTTIVLWKVSTQVYGARVGNA